jgi:hypothetical protein
LSNANQAVTTATAVQEVLQQLQQQQQQQQQQQAQTPAPPLPPPPTQVPTAGPGTPAGQPPKDSQPPINLPLTGTATYVGGMIGIVNGHSIGTGSYQNTWNFGTNSGQVSATFEGARFQGGTVGIANSKSFATPTAIQSSNTNRKLELNGTFFGSGNQPAYQVGNFNVTSTNSGNYSATGVFAGEKR